MASCPTCHAGGGNWRHCLGCGAYWCLNCRLREDRAAATRCPNCRDARAEDRGPDSMLPET